MVGNSTRAHGGKVLVVSSSEPVISVVYNSNKRFVGFVNGINSGSSSFISTVYVRIINNHVDIRLRSTNVAIEVVAAFGSFDIRFESLRSIGSGSHVIAVHAASKIVNGVVYVLLRHTEDVGLTRNGNGSNQFAFFFVAARIVVRISFATFALAFYEVVFVRVRRFAALVATAFNFTSVNGKRIETNLTSRTGKGKAVLRFSKYDGNRCAFCRVGASRKGRKKVVQIEAGIDIVSRLNNNLRHANKFYNNIGVLIETSGICVIANVRRASRLVVGNLNAVLFPNLLFYRIGGTLRLIRKAKRVAFRGVFATALVAAFARRMCFNPSVLELSCAIVLRKDTVNGNRVANNWLGFQRIVSNRTVFVVKAINENGVAFSVFNVYVAVGRTIRAVETGNLTAYVVFFRRVGYKRFT